MSEIDSDIWLRVLAGDNAAWEDLVRRYQPLVYAVAVRAGLSMEDAADCFQQTWVSLYRSRRRIHDPSRLSAWLVTTAKREALRLRRRAEKGDAEAIIHDWASSDPLPDEDLERLEAQAKLEIALGDLDPRCHQVLWAFFFSPEEKSYEDIARDLGMAVNSLGAMRRHCLDKLKGILADYGFTRVRKDEDDPL